MQRRFGGLLLVSVIVLFGLTSSGFTESKKSSQSPEFVPGEILVRTKVSLISGKPEANLKLNKLYSEMGIKVLKTYTIVPGLQQLKVKPGEEAKVIQRLLQDDSVAYAEPNFIYHTALYHRGYLPESISDDPQLPNDESFGVLWGLNNTGQEDSGGVAGVVDADIDAPEAWAQGFQGSKDIVVAIIDTGSDYTHPDLVENAWLNEGETGTYEDEDGNTINRATDVIDNDGNGYVDDVHGWDFVNDDNDPMDDHDHGTHVSGTIGAVGNNEIGVSGVTWHVRIMGVKFLSSTGSGSLDDAVSAIEYADKMGAKVYNNSWGGGGFSQALLDVITATHTSGGVFVAAAGNSSNNNDANPSYPASYDVPNMVAVSATDNSDNMTSWSSFGRNTVHVAAPGNNIYSTTPKDTYQTMSGTSMATPHVVGLVALLWGAHPELTNLEVKERIIKSTEEKRGLIRKVASGGRINADYALKGFYPEKSGEFNPAPPWEVVEHVVESDHNYKSNSKKTWTIKHEGATAIRLHFSNIKTEAGYDFVKIKDSSGTQVDSYDGNVGKIWSFEVPGDTATVILESDGSVNDWGFKIDSYAFKTE